MSYLENIKLTDVPPEVLEQINEAFRDGVLLDDLDEMPTDGGVICGITAKFVLNAADQTSD